MEDKLNHKEDKLKHLADDFQMEVDMDQLWADLEPQLPRTSSRKYVWFLLIGLLLFSGGFATSKIMESINNNTTANSTSKSEIEIISNNTKNINPALEKTELNNISHQTISNTTANEGFQPTTVVKPTKTTTTNNTITNIKNDGSATIAQYSSTNTPVNTITQRSNTNATLPIFQSTANAIVVASPEITNHSPSEILPSSKEENTQKYLIVNEENRPHFQFKSLATLSQMVDRKADEISPRIKPLNKSNWSSLIKASTGIYTTKRDYGALPENIENVLLANEIELPGISTNMGYILQNVNGWRFGIGIAHRMSTYRYTDNLQSVSQEVINGGGSVKIEDDGSITDLGGSILETTITENSLTWHRRHQYVDASLSIGKELLRFNNFSFCADIDAAYNIWSHHNGYYIDDQNEFKAFSSDEAHPYKNTGLRFGGSLALMYDLNKFSFGLSPYASWNSAQNAISSYSYKSKNSYYGIQFNVLYKL